MKFHLHGHLGPSQLAVIGFVNKTNHWLTVREISIRTGVSVDLTMQIVKRLENLDKLAKRRRRGGFDDGILEYRRTGYLNTRRNDLFVVPLDTRLRDYLPADRAREAENY